MKAFEVHSPQSFVNSASFEVIQRPLALESSAFPRVLAAKIKWNSEKLACSSITAVTTLACS